MSDIREVKSQAETLIMIGLSAKDTITATLRSLIEGWKNSGEKSMKGIVEELQGKRWTDEGKFMLHAKNENTGLSEVSVSNNELKEFQKLCKEYGVDFHFQKRPANIEDLFARKQAGEKLSSHQESVVNAFTVYDDKGAPYLKTDSALITFKERDLASMERVLDKMEEKTFGIQQRIIKAKKIAEERRTKKTQTKDKSKVKVKESVKGK